jgi:hypothetical protein
VPGTCQRRKVFLERARDGDTACAIFYLKTQGGWRETERREISAEVSVKRSADELTDAELAEIVRRGGK